MIILDTMEFHSEVGIKRWCSKVFKEGGRWDPVHVTLEEPVLFKVVGLKKQQQK